MPRLEQILPHQGQLELPVEPLGDSRVSRGIRWHLYVRTRQGADVAIRQPQFERARQREERLHRDHVTRAVALELSYGRGVVAPRRSLGIQMQVRVKTPQSPPAPHFP